MSRYKLPFTLYKRGKYWYYRCYTPDGVRTSGISTACTNKTAAYNFCQDLFLKGKLWSSEKTFKAYAQHFLDDDAPYIKDRSKPLAKTTLVLYRNCLNLYLLPDIGDTKLNEINYTYLKNLRASYLDRGKSSAYVIQIFSLLKKIIIAAYRDSIIIKNPFEGFDQIDLIQKTHDAFTRDEVKELYNFMPDNGKKITQFLALTGLRISEAEAVSLSNFKKSPGGIEYIEITQQLLKGSLEDLKTKCSRRNIPVISEIKSLLHDDSFSLPKYYRDFKKFSDLKDPSGDRNMTIHSLRHFFITDSKASDVDDKKVEVLAGHKIKGVEGVYTNFKVDQLKDILSWQKEVYDYLMK